ncbi:hypothetical protein [Metabacillus endolithicus]|uniref:Flagellar hook-length control protein-like C-terminal domain-containing protein n=1 Tax=Metabacillus endolithicus TaxID=1535204 RepID=A0ABW5BVA5_9BACI|nr:hypothetical protein [Metabacillus endolithicus]UPG63243.1 hypothetical protein MVE64_23500 [Metabacillus endolithicus]
MVYPLAIKNLIQTTVEQMTMPQNQLTLKENQVVVGHVLKLFPDQKALIQVGQSKLVAQLEAPINALQNYWFRVKGSNQQGIELKIIKSVETDKLSKHDASAKDFLSLFQQKPTKDNILLSNALLKENIPVTKEQLVSATEIVKNTPKSLIPQTIDAIKFALKQHYQLSENVVSSLVQANSKIPLAKQMDTLFQSLQQVDQPKDQVNQLRSILANVIQKPVEQTVERLFQPEFIKTLSNDEQKVLKGINQNDALQMSRLKQVVKEVFQHTSTPLQSIQPQDRAEITQFSQNEIDIIQKIVNKIPVFSSKEDVLSLFFHHRNEQFEWQKLNMNLESGNAREFQILKETLLAASKELEGSVIKEQVDQLTNRLNGQTLLQQDTGPTTQFITQVPLFALNQTDLTIQWNGKKRSDGTIDPSFCRILFYLQLPNLSETMIDVQIQNRVMTITLINNNEHLKELVSSSSEELKKGLQTMNYKVTSVQVKPFEVEKKISSNSNFSGVNTSYTGVDFKI